MSDLKEDVRFTFMHEILSAITFVFVVMWPTVMPTGLLIIRAHWMRPRFWPTKDALQAFSTHDSAAMLSAKRSTVGYWFDASGWCRK